MFKEGSIVISVPPRETALLGMVGSVFDCRVLMSSRISSELRIAVELLESFCKAQCLPPLRCIARPEMFTHGPSLEWLVDRMAGATDHICLSDGSTLKLVSGLRNHLFAYGLHTHDSFVDFKKLMRRAPELVGQYCSQINSFHRVIFDGLVLEPPPWKLEASERLSPEAVWFHEFYLNPHSLEESAERMLGWGTLDFPCLENFQKISYVPMTNCAVHDDQFQRLVADLIAESYFDPSSCLLLRLPTGAAELTERMRLAIERIRDAHRHLPQARSRNVFLLSGEVGDEALSEIGSRTTWYIHQSFDYWRHRFDTYRLASAIVVFLDRQYTRASKTAERLLSDSFGQAPRFVVATPTVDVDGYPE